MLFKKPEMTPTNLRKLLFAFLALLIILLVSLLYSSGVNIVKRQGVELVHFSQSLQARIDRYRYISWRVFDSTTHNQPPSTTSAPPAEETLLQAGIYSLVTRSPKTETLIFGDHEIPTQYLATRLSSYIETLWAPAKQSWTLYYLNGEDNSLSVVTNSQLRERLNRYEGRNIVSMITARRNEMLQQANTLDERESFSGLRSTEQGTTAGAYLTLRTTFNQPGRLATVLAFDLPLSDLNIDTLDLSQIQIHNEESIAKREFDSSYSLNLSAFSIDISHSLHGAPLSVIYHLSLSSLVKGMASELLLPYVFLLILMLITAISIFFIRENKVQPTTTIDPWVEKLQQFTQELVKNFPLGYLIYDAQQAKILLANELSDHLVAHLNFKKMLDMSPNPYELLRVTVNNDIYQVRHHTSQVISHYHIFTFHEQNRERLVDLQLKKAQSVLDKNHQLRRQLFTQLAETLSLPVTRITTALAHYLTDDNDKQLQEIKSGTSQLNRLTDNIKLLNSLESGKLVIQKERLDIQRIVDEIIERYQPSITQKGIELLVDNTDLTHPTRIGDERLIYRTIETILIYSVENTVWGKIKLKIFQSTEYADRLLIEIVDTGPGLSAGEQENADFPFTHPVMAKNCDRSTSLDLFLCRQVLNAVEGGLLIDSKGHIGTRYQLQFALPFDSQESEADERLLDEVRILVDITADDVRHIICRQLIRWGAKCDFPEDRYSGQQSDLLITDNPEQLEDWGVLLTTSSERRELRPLQRQANTNISRSVLDAILSLIEQQIEEDVLSQGEENVSTSLWGNSEYYSIFEQTVQEDIDKLYAEVNVDDYSALALTAHRLKGVFAMLNLHEGKTRCESIESWVEQHHKTNIIMSISELHQYVDSLLQQGSQKNE